MKEIEPLIFLRRVLGMWQQTRRFLYVRSLYRVEIYVFLKCSMKKLLGIFLPILLIRSSMQKVLPCCLKMLIKQNEKNLITKFEAFVLNIK